MGLFSKDELLGLDIGSNSIKAVELDWRKKSPKLRLFGMVHLPPEAIVDGAFMDSASIVDSIRSLVEGLKVKTKNVAVSISGHSVYIKTINVPNMSKEQLEESIKWEAEQQIPSISRMSTLTSRSWTRRPLRTRCPFFWWRPRRT